MRCHGTLIPPPRIASNPMATATAEALSDAPREFVSKARGLWIGGEEVPAADGRTFETIDPATGDVITEVAQGGPEDADRAVAAAREALDGGWRTLSPAKRAGLIYSFAEALKADLGDLAELESLDNGKPVGYAKGDVAAAVNHLRYYAGWPTKIEGETIPVSTPDVLCYTRREPVGVCAQIVPWNFPVLMSTWKLAPALAAGCTLILKPAEQTPLTGLRLGQLAQEAGIPDGVVNVLTGDGETGAALVDHEGVNKVAFTGSTAVGREIGAKCGRSLKRVTLELGGKSPNIILPDADVEAAIKGSYQGIYFNSGQACNAGSRLYVHSDHFDAVVEGLAEQARGAKLGPGTDPETELGPLVSEEQLGRVTRLHRRGTGGRRRGRRGRRAAGWRRAGRRLLRRAHPLHRRLGRDVDRARGDLRAGAGRDALRRPRGGRRARQRHRVRARRGRLDARHLQGAQARRDARGGQRLHQHLGRRRPRGAVRRLQGVGDRAREGPRQPRRLPRDEDGLGEALAVYRVVRTGLKS